ncbi:DUF4157 domain-containing protein [Amycolatopsis sp. AA4]|uniref:eCIS core domain-containing protein n=1 Tax=Actinomycetes TaxID=1760 RepID=UPI0001B57A06|nr:MULTISPECIES: DUF4157 domain-containing protein [Actinomycetes]ATY09811.1 DUF4157 domain-containing protein [Amycolatopsis sp. AA4]EFL05212.1 predicted protein [Streptomyces sp. AA4]
MGQHVRVPAPVQAEPAAAGGKPLEPDIRHFMEQRFGQDFSQVRVYSDRTAAESAAWLGAKAYTVGERVVFGIGEYRPETASGRRSLAHELAHVVQQRRGGGPAAGHALERSADLAADAVVGGGPVQVSGASAPGLARQAEPDSRVVLANLRGNRVFGAARAAVSVLSAPLRLLGWAITGAAIGMRASGNAGAVVGAGAGQDTMVFVNLESGEATTDVIGYGELGVGVTAGGSEAIVVALRLGPAGQAGNVSGAYAGGSVNVAVKLLAGVGFSVSTGLFSGEEGWVAAAFSLGAEAGARASGSYGVSVADTVAPAIAAWTQRVATGLASGAQTASLIGQGITSVVAQMFGSVLGILDPANWNLTGYTPAEQQAWREFGGYLARVITSTTLDRFLAGEAQGVPVSRRIASIGDVGVFIRVSEAINARYRRMAGGPLRPGDEIWPANAFTERTYLQFLAFMRDQRLLAGAGPEGSFAPAGQRP